jgi:hypothetical protein
MYHQSGVNSCSNISTKWIPTFRVEEVPEFPEVVVYKELGRSEVEPWIEFVND